jgi:hypothetical protein
MEDLVASAESQDISTNKEDEYGEFNRYFSDAWVAKDQCDDPVVWWGVSSQCFLVDADCANMECRRNMAILIRFYSVLPKITWQSQLLARSSSASSQCRPEQMTLDVVAWVMKGLELRSACVMLIAGVD